MSQARALKAISESQREPERARGTFSVPRPTWVLCFQCQHSVPVPEPLPTGDLCLAEAGRQCRSDCSPCRLLFQHKQMETSDSLANFDLFENFFHVSDWGGLEKCHQMHIFHTCKFTTLSSCCGGGEVLRVIGMDSNFSGCAHGTFMAVVHIRLPTALIEGGG